LSPAFLDHDRRSISLPRQVWLGHVQHLFTNQLDWDAPTLERSEGQVSACRFVNWTGGDLRIRDDQALCKIRAEQHNDDLSG
jgi:hypothetical protein